MQFTIAAAYQWPIKGGKNLTVNNSEKAIKSIIEMTCKRFKNKNHTNGLIYNVAYKRLRASAGKTMLDSIVKRIETAQVVIVDITNPNPNVFIELGIALYISRNKPELSVYIIKENKGGKLLDNLPSDLQGYFISTYTVKNSIVVFNDNNSLRMSIVTDINDFFSKINIAFVGTNEIDFK